MAYSVFLSFKNSDNGELTNDRVIGERLYSLLEEHGIKVFFSNVTLLEFGEAAYKDAIDNALDECKIIVIISTKKEYLTSTWIKYEWNSFQQDILSNIKKGSIVTYLDNVPLSEVPLAIRHYQSFNISIDSIEKVVAFIEKALTKFSVTTDEECAIPAKVAPTIIDTTKHASAYDATYKGEFRRLKVQCRNMRQADMPAVNKARQYLKRDKIFVLDVGCGYGHVAKDRFADWDNALILGVDFSPDIIEKARSLNTDSRFVYEVLDIESPDNEDMLSEIMDKYGIDSFDLLFATYILQHIKDPIKFLRIFRKYINDSGCVILRNSEEGSMVSYGDDGLIKKISEKCLKAPGVDNRNAGSMLYYYLYTTGFKNIETNGFFKNLSGLDYDERMSIYEERFSLRTMYYAKALAKDPHNLELKNALGWMEFALEKLQELFGNQAFWYAETMICAFATKK